MLKKRKFSKLFVMMALVGFILSTATNFVGATVFGPINNAYRYPDSRIYTQGYFSLTGDGSHGPVINKLQGCGYYENYLGGTGFRYVSAELGVFIEPSFGYNGWGKTEAYQNGQASNSEYARAVCLSYAQQSHGMGYLWSNMKVTMYKPNSTTIHTPDTNAKESDEMLVMLYEREFNTSTGTYQWKRAGHNAVKINAGFQNIVWTQTYDGPIKPFGEYIMVLDYNALDSGGSYNEKGYWFRLDFRLDPRPGL